MLIAKKYTIETIDSKLLKDNNEVINDIPEINYKGDISKIPLKCHSVFALFGKKVINCRKKKVKAIHKTTE